MSYQIETIEHFEREAKKLKKNFFSLNDEINELIDELEKNPFIGTALRNEFYKIRLAIRSKGKGKRGGARVITYIKIVAETWLPSYPLKMNTQQQCLALNFLCANLCCGGQID
jgi:mRNA-degrading endonuclease RelE of RelBE toxin-antitoxin system